MEIFFSWASVFTGIVHGSCCLHNGAGSRRTQRDEEKAAEEVGAVSGGHDVQEADASEVEGDGMGNALGKPVSPAEAPWPARVAVAVLLVRSVEHPISPGCLQLLMFTFEGAARQLLW